MYVEPSFRRAGLGRAILEHLIEAAATAGYAHIRLDSPDFMTTAHALYRSQGFVDTRPYAESEISDEYKAHWVFMERRVWRHGRERSEGTWFAAMPWGGKAHLVLPSGYECDCGPSATRCRGVRVCERLATTPSQFQPLDGREQIPPAPPDAEHR